MKLFNDFNDYDQIIVSYSGGKDSTAMVLQLLDQGIEPSKIQLWHQCIDGKGDTKTDFFDWPSTEGYTQAFADHFGLGLGWQWRAHGFKGELMRNEQPTGDVYYLEAGTVSPSGLTFKIDTPIRLRSQQHRTGTRLRWPAKSPDLSRRWCSAYLKIDVAARVINNVYQGDKNCPPKILFLTGERREESPARAKYKEIEPHRCNTQSRTVHHYRSVIDLKERDVWDLLEKHQIEPHPAYHLGFPRLSCRSCIFFTPNHWATLQDVDQAAVARLIEMEKELDFTIDNKYTLPELIQLGKSKITRDNQKYIKQAVEPWSGEIITDNWTLPAGAFGEGGGSL